MVLQSLISVSPDGSYYGMVDGRRYHIISGEPLFVAATAMAALEPPELVDPIADTSTPPTSDDVNFERARRIEAGTDLTVPGLVETVALQMREQDEFNILGLAQMAQLRMASADTTAFNFRDRENVVHSVLPSQMLALAIAAATFKSSIIEASWVIKALDPIPSDYAHNSRWP